MKNEMIEEIKEELERLLTMKSQILKLLEEFKLDIIKQGNFVEQYDIKHENNHTLGYLSALELVLSEIDNLIKQIKEM